MRKTTGLFLIDGMEILVPDSDVELSVEDIVDSESGRDESGVLHRMLLRRRMPKWTFTYTDISQEEYAYMERLFEEKDSFNFNYPGIDGAEQMYARAYRTGYSVQFSNLSAGTISSYRFQIAAL